MSKHKLLLADDSATIQKVVNLTFAEEGIDVTTVGDGDSALRHIAVDRPDIVLADVHMPGLNGYQLCERIRSNEETSEMPVVLLVGSFEPFDEAEAGRVGADGHMTKPFQSIRQLISNVKDLIERREAGPTDEIPVEEEPVPPEEAVAPPVENFAPPEPETPVLDLQEDASPPVKKARDTSDIESLYNQSFEETVEIPRNFFDEESYGDVSSDDHLIETATAASLSEETDHAAATEPLRMPSYFQTIPEQEMQQVATLAPVEDRSTDDETPILMTDYQEPAARPAQTDEEDLLDLPPSDAYTFSAPPSEQIEEKAPVVNLSPDLIELIVRKVIERLEEKQEQSSDRAFG